VKGQARLRIAFSFAPETVHYAGMGSRLYETQPAFRKVIDDCDELLRAEFQRGLLPLGQCSWARPALFAVEYGLAQLWRSWGIEPAINSGEGVGEYAAACASGAMEWKSALRSIVQPGGASPAAAGDAPAGADFTIGIGSGGSSESTNGAGRRVPSIEQGRDEWETLLSSLSVLYLSGAPVDWKGFDRDYPRRLVQLPTYPFERKRCYMDASELRPCPGPFQKVEA
jgi:acyl transferase domain-containing protein